MIFDLHIHSKYSTSDSFVEVKDIVKVAKKRGLNGIAISDHNEIRGTIEALKYSSKEFLVIPATEVSSADGHILALGVKKVIQMDLSAKETIDLIHSMGGVAVAAHPYDKFRWGVKDLSWKLNFDAIEINGNCLIGNNEAEKVALEKRRPLVGGSDAHVLSGIGSIATESEAKSVDELLENIRKGKCSYVTKKSNMVNKVSIIKDKIARRCGTSRKL